MQHIADAIHAYTRAGWYLLPLQPGLKIPMPGTQGVKDATNDPEKLMGWVAAAQISGQQINLGLAMGRSGLVAVDIDRRSGGLETIERLAAQGKALPQTLTVATAQAGRHHYYWAPKNEKVKNAKGKLPGVDIKAGNGYVILPPSRLVETANHAAGEYTWLKADCGISPLPGWLQDLIVERPVSANKVRQEARRAPLRGPTSKPEARLQSMCQGLRSLPPNSYRNNYLFWAANRAAEMVAQGEVSQSLATRELYAAALDCGLTSHETRATINSALRTTLTE